MRTNTVTVAREDRPVGANVTLNGKPATVIGRRNDFATIATLDQSASFDWAWSTVVKVIAKGGHFKS